MLPKFCVQVSKRIEKVFLSGNEIGDKGATALAEAFKEYYSQYELEEVCGRHGVHLDYVDTAPDYLKLARSIFSDLSHPAHRQFFKAILPDLEKRCKQRIGNSAWDEHLYHQQMLPLFKQFQQMLVREPPKPAAGARVRIGIDDADRDPLMGLKETCLDE